MSKTNIFIYFLVVLIFVFGAYYFFLKTKSNFSDSGPWKEEAEQPLVGGDRDEHGCIPSAGYTWCEEKNKCLRTWEEPCVKEESGSQLEAIKDQIKSALVEKHGKDAENLNVSVAKVEGNYCTVSEFR